MVAEDGTAPPSVGKASNHVLYTTPRNKGRRFRTSQRKCLLSGISLFLALALQKLPQFPAVCGYEIFFQWTGLELHHDIVVIGRDKAAAALKVGDLHRFRVREMEGLLNPFCFIVLQIQNDFGFAVVDDAFPETPLVQIEKVIKVLAGADR